MDHFGDFLQFLFAGLTGGAIYTLIALGFGVVHRTMGIVNFVQVDFVTIGGMFFYTAAVTEGLGTPIALAAAVILSGLVGAAVELVGLRPARSQNHTILIFLTVGISIVARGVIKAIWGKNRLAVPPLAGDEPLSLLGATVLPQTVWILAITGLSIAALSLFYRKTSLGLAMRGVAANPAAAAAVGLPVGLIRSASFALAGGLGGLAGVLITPITTLGYDVGVLLGLKGFAAAILGGFGSFPGAILGGLSLGLAESLGAAYVSSAYKDVTAFVILLLVLFIRPRGLLGGAR